MSDIGQVSKGWFVGAGIMLIVLGMAAIALPLVAAVAIEVLLGWILLMSGIVKIVHSFRAMSSGKCLLRLLGGAFYLVAGGILLAYPLQGVLTLTMVLIFLFILEGIIKLTVALRLRSTPNWGWMLASGIAGLVLAGIIWAGWPTSAAWAIGLIVGINLMFGGGTMLMLSAGEK